MVSNARLGIWEQKMGMIEAPAVFAWLLHDPTLSTSSGELEPFAGDEVQWAACLRPHSRLAISGSAGLEG